MERRYNKIERYYTEGNTVRKVYSNVAPQEEIRRERKVQPKQEKVLAPSLGYMLSIIAAATVVVALSIAFLYMQARNNENANKITTLQNTVADLDADNDARELAILSNIDYDKIYDRALELGMTKVTNDQVVEYDRGTLEYVKQYEDIPE